MNQINRLLGTCVIGLLLSALCSTFAQAEEQKPYTWQFDLGVSLQHKTNIIDSLDDTDGELSLAVLGAGGIYYDNFFIESSPYTSQPLTFGYTFRETNSTSLSLVGMSWFATISEQEQQQGNRLDGINKRRSSFEVGIEYLKQFQRSDLRLRALHDALGRHQGFLFSLDHSRPIYKDKWLFIPSWGLTYLSEDMVDYYYGVKPDEVTAQRPLYKAGAGWSLSGRLYVEYPMGDDWSLFAFASYSKFNNAITDSPITSISSGGHVIAVGALWNF